MTQFRSRVSGFFGIVTVIVTGDLELVVFATDIDAAYGINFGRNDVTYPNSCVVIGQLVRCPVARTAAAFRESNHFPMTVASGLHQHQAATRLTN